MLLTVSNNAIIIKNLIEGELRKYHVSQLEFYGYKKADGYFIKYCQSLDTDALKLEQYLRDEDLHFHVSNAFSQLINSVLDAENERSDLLEKGQRIKTNKFNLDEINQFMLDLSHLPRTLKDHQVKAAFHLFSVKNGANFSVPGSGKTSVVLAVYEKMRLEGKCNTLFVVGPPSSFQPWKSEFEATLGRKPDSVTLSGGNKGLRKAEYYKFFDESAEIYLSTFHTILNDHNDVINFFRQREIKAFLVVDEAHYMKQLNGSWANSLLKISSFAEYRCVLTGTPIPKSYTDIFNLFDFLIPKGNVLTEDDRIKINLCEKKGQDKEVKKILEEKIGPLFYRVRKKDLGLMPARFHDPIIVKMNPVEERIHTYIKSRITDLSREEFLENHDILSRLWRGRMIRLRQTTSYSGLLLKSIKNYKESIIDPGSELYDLIANYDSTEVPAKLEYLLLMVKNLNSSGQKVLIWSNFIDTLKLIKSHLSETNITSEMIYGQTPTNKDIRRNFFEEKTREKIRDEFVDPESGLDVLIANPAACAESISLHKTCHHAIYYDLSYNCAQYLQSLDRIHRVGGSEKTISNYYFLNYNNSVDLDIRNNLEKKAAKMYDIIDRDYEVYNLDLFEEEADDDIAAYKRLFTV